MNEQHARFSFRLIGRTLLRQARWALLMVGLALLWIPSIAEAGLLALLPGQILLLLGSWLLLRRLPLSDGPMLPVWLFGLIVYTLILHLHRISPELLHWKVLGGIVSLAYGAMALEFLVAEVRVHRPWQSRRGEKFMLVLAAIAGLGGLLLGSALLFMPLLIRPVMRWLRQRGLRRVLVWYFLLLIPVVILVTFREAIGLNMMIDTSGANLHLPGPAQGRMDELLGPAYSLAQAWLWLQLPAALLILVGRLLKQSRIRTKLAMNALFTGLLPVLLVSFLLISMSVVVLGSYRANLVTMRVDERMDSGRLVTAWFAQAYADPLDREAQRRFEQQIRGMGDENHMGRGFFSLYLRGDAPDPSLPDSLRTERWLRLVSSWRMPSDFPLREIVLPAAWRNGPVTGIIRVGSRALQVSMVEQENLLALGFFPLDAEALERISASVGSGIRLVSVKDDEFAYFGFNQIGFRLPCEVIELGNTPDFPGPEDPFSRRLFKIGIARLGHAGFPLGTKGERLLVQAEALPGRMLPAMLRGERSVIFPYATLAILQLMLLLPLLLLGVWIAWMINLRITRSTSELRRGTEELARGNLNLRLPEHTGDELGKLARSFNDMSARIRANMRELATKERLERELSIARSIQQGLLPEKAPDHEQLEISGSCQMALEVGGDYYDFRHRAGRELALAVGDVSGKGVAAALLMSNLQASWRSLLEIELDPALLNRRLNEQLAASTADELFITFVHGQFRETENSLRFQYSNAGHNPPLLVREGRCRTLDCGGMALGMFSGAEYGKDEVQLVQDDWLVFYTDGLTEALNQDEEEFGDQRLHQLLEKTRSTSAGELQQEVLAAVRRFEEGAPRADDLTLIVLRVKGNHVGKDRT